MSGYLVHPHRFTRMQDAGLARSESLVAGELTRRERLAGPGAVLPEGPSDLSVLRSFLVLAWCEFSAAWRAAARRRRAVQQFKRMDRRLLMDVGIPRGQARDVADAMLAARAPAAPAPDCATAPAWLEARPAV